MYILLELTGRICYPFLWLIFWIMYQIVMLPLKLIWYICWFSFWFGYKTTMLLARSLWTCLVALLKIGVRYATNRRTQ